MALAAIARQNFPGGVPMHWMLDWETPFALSIVAARGNTIDDADGLTYVDFCLGDSGALFGHSPPAVAGAIGEQATRGLTAMLPGPDGRRRPAVGAIVRPAYWQATATASDANRAVIRWSRAITGRPRLLVFDGCYHGQVDETLAECDAEGRTVPLPALVGPIAGATANTLMVPFNDLAACEAALAEGEVALVLTEPALTNTGMVLPEPGFLEALLTLARTHGALVAFDETHTISTGRGGHTGAGRLSPDFLGRRQTDRRRAAGRRLWLHRRRRGRHAPRPGRASRWLIAASARRSPATFSPWRRSGPASPR